MGRSRCVRFTALRIVSEMGFEQRLDAVLSGIERFSDVLDALPLGCNAGCCMVEGGGARGNITGLPTCPRLPPKQGDSDGRPCHQNRDSQGRSTPLCGGCKPQKADMTSRSDEDLVIAEQSVPPVRDRG